MLSVADRAGGTTPGDRPPRHNTRRLADPLVGAKRTVTNDGSVRQPGLHACQPAGGLETRSDADLSATKPTLVTPGEIAGVVSLRLAIPARLDLGRVPAAFGRADADWLGQRVPDEASEIRRFSCDLEMSVGLDRPAMFRKSAIVGVGAPVRHDDSWLVPVEWRAATLAPLFPVFAGHLRLRADRIELDGHYAPPGGTIGYVLDRALLRIAARGTGRWFLRKVVSVLEVDADRFGEDARLLAQERKQ